MTPGSQVNLKDLRSDDDSGDDKKGPKSESSKKPRPKTTPTAERELRGRLSDCFDRIAESVRQRGDDELADLLADDAAIMAQGLVSLTRPFRALRTPLLALVAIVEPALAFGRVVRLLAGRWADRRARAAEAAAMAAEPQ